MRVQEEFDAGYGGVQPLSRIGEPVSEPLAVGVVTTVADESAVDAVADADLAIVPQLTDELASGRVDVF